ncbi:cytochrome c oxidase assembly factor Coa1 family protein [Lysobacter sp. CA199]|uniref:cytochrome c oxidase assembly factor Coa1 family protein n=1 Tax=Lysobacter sp. CA199 TaxID=3455608 RepID=UPI003F8D4A41
MNDRPNPGWFGRNWKWFVPTGCLTLVLFGALLLAGLIGLGLKGVSGLFAGSEPVRHSIELAEADPAVVAALGKPLEAGMMIQGSMQTHNDDGSADLSLPLTGPKGKGKLYLKAERSAGRWTYSLIEIAIDGSDQRIDLLGKGEGANGRASPDREIAPPDIDQPPAQAPSKHPAAPKDESEQDQPPEEGAPKVNAMAAAVP